MASKYLNLHGFSEETQPWPLPAFMLSHLILGWSKAFFLTE